MKVPNREPESSDRPINLARHMSLAIIAPVVTLIALGALLAWQITQLRDSAEWVSHTNKVLARFGDLQTRISEKESALRGFLLGGDEALRTAYATTTPSSVLEELVEETKDNETQQGRLAELRATLGEWTSAADRAVAARQEIDQAELRRRTAYIARSRELIGAAVAMERDLLFERERQNESTESKSTFAFLAMLGLAAGAIAFISRRQLSVVTKAFAAIVGSERSAKNLARDQEWVQRGEAQVASALVGEATIEEVGRHGLEALFNHTGAQVGSIYISRGGELVRVAGIGIPEDLPVVRTTANRGQLGRVMETGKPVRMREAEAQVVLDGGIAKATTVDLIIAPLKIGDRITGAVGLGFTEEPHDRSFELLANVATPVAQALRAAEQRARLQELLEETQRQGEELQTQHEELRVTNEELEQQGQQLREAHARQQNIQHELEAANANLEEQTAALEVGREELLRTQSDLEQHAQELQRASQYKSEFLARMSHELRTPLNSTLILARLLGDNVNGNLSEEQVRYANTIYSAGNDLLVLINDILDLAKIEAGRLELRLGEMSFERVRDTLTREFEPVARNKGLELAVEIGPGVPELVTTDEQRVIQVLRNLASNAIKFTDKGGVRIAFLRAGDRVDVSVTDTGIGIPDNQQEAVFEAFHQVDGGVSRRHGGTGLGLAISRDLSVLLGGSLRLTSTPGRGSTFTFDVPLAPPAQKARTASHDLKTPASTPVLPAPTSRVPRMPAATPVEKKLPTPTPPSGYDDRDGLAQGTRRLLVIEDDVKFASVLRDLARELKYQVLLAHTADEGVELAMRHRPDGILLDVKLPDHSGLSVLERLKRQPAIRHVPIHMMSGEDFSRRSMELGAVGYVLKPASRDELVGAIRRIEDRTSQSVRRVLVVEDDPVQADALRALLGGTAAEITATPTASEALAQLSATTFDCVVMDLRLADGTGFELLEKMTADDRITFPPVIIYTGKALSDEEEAKLRTYSSSIIVKGARSPERLLDEVTLFLHSVESDLPKERQNQLREVRNREAIFEGRTVLIVEDDVRNVFALSSLLEPRGLKTIIARNGREALEALAKVSNTIDLVLMDVMMPEMNGIEATKHIRANPALKELPIIALTAKAMADDRQACLDAGASDYLSKPIDVDMLLSLLRVWMPR